VSLYMSLEVPVTVTTSPNGRNVAVDNTNYTAPVNFYWITNTSHTVSAPSPQYGADNQTRYRFGSWSDGKVQTHTIVAPLGGTNLMATFATDYLLDIIISPTNGGTVVTVPAGPWQGAHKPVSLTATPNEAFVFGSWNGADCVTGNTAELTMNGYRQVSAEFQEQVTPFRITPGLLPDGRVELQFAIPGISLATVLGSTNLVDWDELGSATLTNGIGRFTDDHSTNHFVRYYRVRIP